jgi:hypothetical protein
VQVLGTLRARTVLVLVSVSVLVLVLVFDLDFRFWFLVLVFLLVSFDHRTDSQAADRIRQQRLSATSHPVPHRL